MISVNIHEAKTKLSALLRMIEEKGEPIIICRNGTPVAEIRPIEEAGDPLAQNPRLTGVIFNEDPALPLKENDWPDELR